MISNEREYAMSRAAERRFTEALERFDRTNTESDPVLRRAMRGSIESRLIELRDDLAAYERLRGGAVQQLVAESLDELPERIIQARVAAGLTQKDLARRLGLKAQQIQRYEATRYSGAKVERLQDIADALGVRTRTTIDI